mmetsp:Transcript_71212/g.225089  ORF Transcript_71212/g.225089 Transcript_71212/m.225089 type:complete len:186 (+) Transcript_71212:205-762(+)
MSNIVAVAWQRYQRQLQRQPLPTKAVTAACIAALSDVVAAWLVPGKKQELSRTAKMGLFGLLWSGPSMHFWQNFMERTFRGKKDGTTVIRKTVFDQLTYGPMCNVLFMSWITLVVERQGLSALLAKIQRDFAAVQAKGWRLWPAATFINYQFVPLQLRVLFANCVALLWSTTLILSSQTRPAVRP